MDGSAHKKKNHKTTRVHGNCNIKVAWAVPLNGIRASMGLFEKKTLHGPKTQRLNWFCRA